MTVRRQSEVIQRGDCSGSLLGPGNMIPDALAESFEAVGAKQEPKFERSESATLGYGPLAVIGNF